MRAITKGDEPRSLTEHRARAHSDFDNYQAKDELRQSLVAEQRGLCCYCMGRIHPESASMKIEHWRCQAHYPDEQLDYRNLLGACLGGQGRPERLQHCDTRKGNRDLRWNPADPSHRIETRVRYELNGSIRAADDANFDAQLEDVLNLNLPVLMSNRRSVLDAVLDWWRREKARIGGPVPRSGFIRKRDAYVRGNGQLQPFCQVAVWWLEQRLAKMAA